MASRTAHTWQEIKLSLSAVRRLVSLSVGQISLVRPCAYLAQDELSLRSVGHLRRRGTSGHLGESGGPEFGNGWQ